MKRTIISTITWAYPTTESMEGLDGDDLDEQSDDFTTEAGNIENAFVDKDDASFDIVETTGRSKPSNVSVVEWTCER